MWHLDGMKKVTDAYGSKNRGEEANQRSQFELLAQTGLKDSGGRMLVFCFPMDKVGFLLLSYKLFAIANSPLFGIPLKSPSDSQAANGFDVAVFEVKYTFPNGLSPVTILNQNTSL